MLPPSRSQHSMAVIARLKPGMAFEQARADMDVVGKRLSEQYPRDEPGARATPLHAAAVAGRRCPGAAARAARRSWARPADRVRQRGDAAARESGQQGPRDRRAPGARRRTGPAGQAAADRERAARGCRRRRGRAGRRLGAQRVPCDRSRQLCGAAWIDGVGVDLRVLGVAMVVSAVTGLVFGIIPA